MSSLEQHIDRSRHHRQPRRMGERYDVEQAHRDGRHDSDHHEDELHWMTVCPLCRLDGLTDLDDLLPGGGGE